MVRRCVRGQCESQARVILPTPSSCEEWQVNMVNQRGSLSGSIHSCYEENGVSHAWRTALNKHLSRHLRRADTNSPAKRTPPHLQDGNETK